MSTVLLPDHPSARPEAVPGDSSRNTSIRYFNFYRLVVATLLAVFGALFRIGEQLPVVYAMVVLAYWFAAVCFMLITPRTRAHLNSLLMWQVALDVVTLTAIMFISGNQRGSVPYLLMTTLAGAALVGEGRMVLGFAAMATIAVLFEQLARIVLDEFRAEELTRTGITCLGYFAVAMVARLLARRALENELLARQRGAALQRQMRVNAQIIEDMQDGVVVIDDGGSVRFCNPASAPLLGVSLIEGERIGTRVPELLSAELGQLTEGAVRFDRTGKTVHVRAVKVDEGGDQVLYLEDLDRIEEQARQIKLAALGRLTANIAHEIRNPLASVSQAAELLVDEKRAQMQQRLARIVFDNAARIDRIVRDVMEVGHRDRITQEVLDVELFVQNLIEEFAMHTPLARTATSLQVKGKPGILFDRVHLAQILGNLLSNALRYCRQLAGSVQIQVSQLGENRVLIVVKDDGAGIAPQERERVFEPFHTTDPKGTGLGLYVARELAEANAALLVLVDSEVGAEFHLEARAATLRPVTPDE